MDHYPSPVSPRPVTHRTKRPPVGDIPSPPSSITTSPPSSPTFSNRRPNNNRVNSPHSLFDTSFHPHGTSKEDSDTHTLNSNPNNDPAISQTPHGGVSMLPCAVLRGRSSLMVVRRRPSAVDMALSEERSRCDCDSIERQGLDLMEPRPVDQNITMSFHDANMASNSGQTEASKRHTYPSTARTSFSSDGRAVVVQQPRFVMGGIFEVMEGRA